MQALKSIYMHSTSCRPHSFYATLIKEKVKRKWRRNKEEITIDRALIGNRVNIVSLNKSREDTISHQNERISCSADDIFQFDSGLMGFAAVLFCTGILPKNGRTQDFVQTRSYTNMHQVTQKCKWVARYPNEARQSTSFQSVARNMEFEFLD